MSIQKKIAPRFLFLFRPKFRMFFCLICVCSVIVYVIMTTDMLDMRIDPNSDAFEISDGMCRSYGMESMENGKYASHCINPRQFAFHLLRNRLRTPVVTMFTSVHIGGINYENDLHDFKTFSGVMQNWGSLKPWINPVLFAAIHGENIKHQELTELLKFGWSVEEAPKLISGMPVLRDMFSVISSRSVYHTPFVGYAKPGILFDNSIVETLMYISRIPKDKLEGNGLLIIGRSKNIDFFNYTNQYGNMSFITKLYENGSMNEPSDINYMISTRTGFPWEILPEFVAGQPSFEKWLGMKAVERNITMIDATLSLHSILQSNQNFQLEEKHLKSLCVQKEFNDKLNKITQGQTVCAGYFTKRDNFDGYLRMYKRRRRLNICKNILDYGHMANETIYC